MKRSHKVILSVVAFVCLVACANFTPRKGWNKSYGPVVPHDTFPADCSLCHESGGWNKLKKDFEYDHEKQTGVALIGVHNTAACLLCHNDRGPVKQFADKGCRGCHEDKHRGRLGAQCGDCHDQETWRPREAISRHSRTRFPLVGAHASADCTRCHKGGAAETYEVPSIACESCHAQDITRSTGLDHTAQGLVDRCDRCHNPVAWKPAGFSHPTSFPLNGGHSRSSCNECHTTPGTFTGLSTECASCHLADFQATTDPNHTAAAFGTTCTQCHTTARWEGARFEHTPAFALTAGHAGRSCSECHTTPGTYTGLTGACTACHTDDYQRTTDPNHGAQGYSTTCMQCHNTSRWQGATFEHPSTFALTRGHAGRSCTSCHTTPGVYTGLTTDCASCHTDDFQQTTNPNHVAGGFSTNCTQCHTTARWQGATFQHPSSFPLANGHSGRSCNDCHTTPGVYTGLSTACASCHTDDYQRTTNPNHGTSGFSTTCTECHATTQWQGASFRHPSSFPLSNGHANRSCTLCHTTPGLYTGLSTTCSSCHTDDFQATTDPSHSAAGFSTTCTQCHNTTQWQGATFTHPSTFTLTNGHAGRSCNACHTTPGTYAGLTTTCSSCHTDDYQQTTDPNHVAASFSTSCNQCHNTTRWQGATFQHAAGFPLTNGHAGRTCSQCHTTPGVYTGLTNACNTCHQDDYQRTTDPNHVTGGYSTNCTECHGTVQWQGASFRHTSSFPLTNGHAARACTSCHTTPGVYTGLSTTCSTCHLDDYQRTTDPNHVTAAFPTNCTQCHNTSQWTGATFQHPSTFALANGHAGRACTACHTTPGVFTGLSTTCSSCHTDDFQRTTNPNHVNAAFPTNCTQCHNTTMWQGATFQHASAFPLTAGHAGRACTSCHTTPGVYTGLATTCSACHTDDFQRTTNPNHVTGGFPTNCTQCHNTTMWQGATFQHPASFALTNGHAARSCTACHTVPGVFTGLSTACASCHTDDYQGTTDPYHAAAGFSTTCTQCHNTSAWLGATFQHRSTFPLANGHAGRTCAECHTTPGVYSGASTACSSCHTDDFQRTTNPNHVGAGMPTTCAQCHNTSTWLGATFTHPPSFALTNAHAGRACNACHTTPGVYTGLTTDCASCHLDDYQATTNPRHAQLGYPTSCALCHTATVWTNATFNHPRINRGGHSSLSCANCHTVPAATPAFSCTHCHEHDRTGTDRDHREVNNYQYLSSACYNCHRR